MNEQSKVEFHGEQFHGFWAETEWLYQFNNDGTFKFSNDGHYGGSDVKGMYAVIDSIILLNPETDWVSSDGVLMPKLKIINSETLRDYFINFYCKDLDSLNYYNGNKYEVEDKIKELLSSIPECKSKIIELENNAIENENLSEPQLEFDKIFKVNGEEFLSFNLYQFDEADYHNQYSSLRMFVKKSPFEVYKYEIAGDQLHLIYKNDEVKFSYKQIASSQF
ncbi:MAG: hypothetical protein CMO01_19950 [Thalassobius sp.]|nr:hypothetical protein [Thalassovita sp.]